MKLSLHKSSLLLASVITIMMASCRVTPDPADLDAQWQVLTIDYTDGTTDEPASTYYAFYRSVVNLRAIGGPGNSYQRAGNLALSDDNSVMTLDFPYSNAEILSYWGMDSTTTVFQIVELKKESLVLRSDYATITFRKF